MGASRPPSYLIDTSVVIALEQQRPIGALPDDGAWYLSAITVGELKRGVLTGVDAATRSRRLDTWVDARQLFEIVPVDDIVANTWGEYQAIAAGEQRKLATPDALIAATAATFGYILVTRDRGFEWYPDLEVLIV